MVHNSHTSSDPLVIYIRTCSFLNIVHCGKILLDQCSYVGLLWSAILQSNSRFSTLKIQSNNIVIPLSKLSSRYIFWAISESLNIDLSKIEKKEIDHDFISSCQDELQCNCCSSCSYLFLSFLKLILDINLLVASRSWWHWSW